MHPNPIRDVFNADNPNYFYGIVDGYKGYYGDDDLYCS